MVRTSIVPPIISVGKQNPCSKKGKALEQGGANELTFTSRFFFLIYFL